MICLEKLLKEFSAISDYKIVRKHRESNEIFYVHKNVETLRKTDTINTFVTVYVKNEDGTLGEATFEVFDYQLEDELKKVINDNIFRATLIKNQYYEIPSDKEEVKNNESNLSLMTLKEASLKITNILDSIKMEDDASINATEIFVVKNTTNIVNSKGINKEDSSYSIMIEAIPTFTKDNESVELYEQYNTSSIDEAQIKEEITTSLDNVKARYLAIKPDYEIEAPVLLHILDAEVIYENIIGELHYRSVYTDSNFYKVGDLIQTKPEHDKLNISLEAFIEGSSDNHSFDADGITLKSVELIEDSKVKNYFGDNRFAYYLGVKPTGNMTNMLVENGTTPSSELLKGKYLECISFSGLQVDVFNDYIGGEVRLAKYFDGNKVIPITGISISGKLSDVLNTIVLSKEYEVKNSIKAPKLIKLDNMKIF